MVSNRFILGGLAAMGLTSIGVVMLLSDIVFSPALTAIITAAAVLACASFWCLMPLARRRAITRAGAGRGRALTRRPDAA